MKTHLQSQSFAVSLQDVSQHDVSFEKTTHRRPGKRNRRVRRGSARGILIAALVLAGLGGGGYYLWQERGSRMVSADDKPILTTIHQGPFEHIVLEQGEIESSSNNEVKCEVQGRGGSGTPILTVIPEGTFVKKGDILCELDSSALEQEAKTQRIVVSTAEATVISSEAAVSKAEISRQEYLEGTYLTERNVILSEISVAKQNLRKAELSLQSAERLAAKGTLKPLQIEAEEYAVQNAQSTLESAEGRLRVLDELTKAKMLVQLDSDIATAKAMLDSDQNTLLEEKSKLAEVEVQIQACRVKAPMDGQVVYASKQGNRGGADFVVEPGAVVREQQTIFLLPDPTKMQVRAKVNESRITLIREGMPVRIKVGAVQSELLGRVVKVNKYAEPGNWWGSNVKEYAVFVEILDPPETIRTGMTAEVRIVVEQLSNATQIPVLAVYETKGHHFVLVQSGESWTTKPIKILAANESSVTVEESNDGVAPGEKVVLNPRLHLNKMKIPDIEVKDDREMLAKIAAEFVPRVHAEEERPPMGEHGNEHGDRQPGGQPGGHGGAPGTGFGGHPGGSQPGAGNPGQAPGQIPGGNAPAPNAAPRAELDSHPTQAAEKQVSSESDAERATDLPSKPESLSIVSGPGGGPARGARVSQ